MINTDTLSDKFLTELIKNTTTIQQSDLPNQEKIKAFKTLISQLNKLY